MPTDSIVCTTPITAATMPKAGMPSPSLAMHCAGTSALMVVGLDLVVHQVFDLERVHVAGHHQAQVIGDEFDNVVVGQHASGTSRTPGSAPGASISPSIDIRPSLRTLDSTSNISDISSMYISRCSLRALEQGRQRLYGGLDGLGRIADEESAERGAADHQQFERLQQRGHVAAAQDEAAEHGRAHDDVTNNDKHGTPDR
jgi:hypothetical protein